MSLSELVKHTFEGCPKFHPLVLDTFVPCDENRKPQFKFNNIKNIGHSKILMTNKPKSPQSFVDPLFDDFIQKNEDLRERIFTMADYKSAIGNVNRYIKSIEKCDFKNIKPNDFLLDRSVEYVVDMLAPFLGGKTMQQRVDFNGDTSPGLPWHNIKNPNTGKNFQNKREIVNSPEFPSIVDAMYDPIFNIFNKIEFLPWSEIVTNKKLRTVFNGPVDFVINQKLMYDAQDEALISSCTDYINQWSRYGFTRQYGGFDELARSHLSLSEEFDEDILHLAADASGWDRRFPLMDEVYHVRETLYQLRRKMNQIEQTRAQFIRRNIVRPFCSLFNGEIIQRECGNVSGSGKTTSDNTIGHMIITMYVLLYCYFEKHGCLPTLEQIKKHTRVSLYGDDNLLSVVFSFFCDTLDIFLSNYRKIYESFGLNVKESAFHYKLNQLDGLEFLGGKFLKSSNRFVAEPRYGKIASSIVYLLDGLRNMQQHVSIIEAASALLYDVPTDSAEFLRLLLSKYASFVMDKYQTEIPASNYRFLCTVADNKPNLEFLVFGFEASYFYDFFIDNGFETTKMQDLNGSLFFDCSSFPIFFLEQQGRQRVGMEGFKSVYKTMEFNNALSDSSDLTSWIRQKFCEEGLVTFTSSSFKQYKSKNNYVGELLEFCVKTKNTPPMYNFLKVNGDHTPNQWSCLVNFILNGKTVCSIVDGPSKSEAKNLAAYSITRFTNKATNGEAIDLVSINGIYFIQKNKIDVVDNQLLFFQELIRGIRVYNTLSPTVRPQSPFHAFFDRKVPVDVLSATLVTWLKNKEQSPCDYVDELSFNIDKLSLNNKGEYVQTFFSGFNPYGNQQIDVCGQTHPEFYRGRVPEFHFQPMLFNYPHVFIPFRYNNNYRFSDGQINFLSSYADRYFREQGTTPSQLVTSFCDERRTEQYLDDIYESSDEDDDIYYDRICSISYDEWYRVFFEGFNPYGNGQKRMTRAKFFLKHNGSPAQKEAAWELYKSKKAPKNKKQKVKMPPLPPTPPKKKRVQKRINGVTGNLKTTGLPVSIPKTMSMHPLHLAECSARWLLFLTNPFLAIGDMPPYTTWWSKTYGNEVHTKLPCIPTPPCFPSQKIYGIWRGNFTVGTAGTGFIMLCPTRLGNNYSGAGNSTCPIIISAATYAGIAQFPTCDTGAAPAAGVVMTNLITPFTEAALLNGAIKYRVPYAGVRVSYSSALLNVAGDYCHFQSPDHTTLSTVADNGAFSTQPGYYTKPVNKDDWETQVWTPAEEADFQYKSDIVFGAAVPPYVPTITQTSHHLGIMIVGAPAGATLRAEVIVGYEIIGTGVTGKTPSEADPVGFGSVQSFVNPDVAKVVNQNPGFLDRLVQNADVTRLAEAVGNFGIRKAVDYGVNYFAPGLPALMDVTSNSYTVSNGVTVTDADEEVYVPATRNELRSTSQPTGHEVRIGLNAAHNHGNIHTFGGQNPARLGSDLDTVVRAVATMLGVDPPQQANPHPGG